MNFLEDLKRYANVRTLSIAFPASIFDNTPTQQLEAYLVGQVARAAVVFNICEIVIFTEYSCDHTRVDRLIKLFEYAECPQYLRKKIFAIEPDLKYAGLIHPLEAQHHLRTSQIDCPYREGVTCQHLKKEIKGSSIEFTEINIGLNKPVIVPGHHEINTRVTVKVDPNDLRKIQSLLGPTIIELPKATLVSPVEPVEKLNLHWGYYVRRADSLTSAIRRNTFVPDKENFYDLIIGTSERGISIDELEFKKTSHPPANERGSKKQRNEFQHILIVFGGVKGLEHSAQCDNELKGCKEIEKIFDYYVNTCPNQGSTTIRTEEAILISLSAMRQKLKL